MSEKQEIDFEEIFKSEGGEPVSCGHCGGDITEQVSKAMKGKAKGGSGHARIGNKPDPRRNGDSKSDEGGPPSGTKWHSSLRGGKKDDVQGREPTQPKNPVVKKSLFPVVEHYSAVEYVGASVDEVISKNAEAALSKSGGPSSHFIASARNLQMEKESSEIKALREAASKIS